MVVVIYISPLLLNLNSLDNKEWNDFIISIICATPRVMNYLANIKNLKEKAFITLFRYLFLKVQQRKYSLNIEGL